MFIQMLCILARARAVFSMTISFLSFCFHSSDRNHSSHPFCYLFYRSLFTDNLHPPLLFPFLSNSYHRQSYFPLSDSIFITDNLSPQILFIIPSPIIFSSITFHYKHNLFGPPFTNTMVINLWVPNIARKVSDITFLSVSNFPFLWHSSYTTIYKLV